MASSDGGRLYVRETAHVEIIPADQSPRQHVVAGVGDWTTPDGLPVNDAEIIAKLENDALINAVNGVVRALLNDDVKAQLAPIISQMLERDTITPEDYKELNKYGFPALDITAEMLGISTLEAHERLSRIGIPRPLFTVLMQEWAVARNAIQGE